MLDVLGQLGGAAAERDVLDLVRRRAPTAAGARLLGRLAKAGGRAAVPALVKHLSTAVAAADRPRALALFAALAQGTGGLPREVGYVGLRNLLAPGPIPGGEEPVAPARRRGRAVTARGTRRASRRR